MPARGHNDSDSVHELLLAVLAASRLTGGPRAACFLNPYTHRTLVELQISCHD